MSSRISGGISRRFGEGLRVDFFEFLENFEERARQRAEGKRRRRVRRREESVSSIVVRMVVRVS